MGREDWYRRTTWTAEDQAAFRARLARSRSAYAKVQSLRIQALYLAEAGLYEPALSLLDEAATYPEESEQTMILQQRAECLKALKRFDEMHAVYREAIVSLGRNPGWRSNTGLSWFTNGWAVASGEQRIEIVRALADDVQAESMMTPGLAFRFAAAFVRVNEDCAGTREEIALWARRALDAAAATRSGLRNHPLHDLVPPLDDASRERLERLAGDAEG